MISVWWSQNKRYTITAIRPTTDFGVCLTRLSATAAKTAILEVAFQALAEAAITAVGEMTFIAAVTVGPNSITVFRHNTAHAQSFTAAKESAAMIAVALPAQILQRQ